jgi:L-asparagine oxygenase
MEKMFTTGIDLSFRTNGEEDREIPISIISKGANGRLSFTYDVTVIKGESWIAKELLEEVQWAIEQCTQEIVLKTGDLLVIDNRNTIHGRKPFQARYDGTDRWVQRVLVRKELPPDNQIDGHIITTDLG